MSSTPSVIQLGLKLLKKGRLDANELAPYREAFSILDLDISAPPEACRTSFGFFRS